MPIINGRYYMNSQFGAAVEGARLEADVAPEEDSTSSGSAFEPLAANKARQAESKTPSAHNQRKKPKHLSGDATYYDLPGSNTASGHPFNPNEMSAAMTGEKVRLGQTVTVTYTHKDSHGKPASKSIWS
jgi:rare lipoprotein A (peptidoglycan hydrolase)